MKTCSECGQTLALSEFYKHASGKNGLRSECRTCILKRNADWDQNNLARRRAISKRGSLRRNYNLTESKYAQMVSSQNGVCAICGRMQTQKAYKRLDVDHCHKTGIVRGLLCNSCNVSIGRMNDDPALLRKAAEYLESYATARLSGSAGSGPPPTACPPA